MAEYTVRAGEREPIDLYLRQRNAPYDLTRATAVILHLIDNTGYTEHFSTEDASPIIEMVEPLADGIIRLSPPSSILRPQLAQAPNPETRTPQDFWSSHQSCVDAYCEIQTATIPHNAPRIGGNHIVISEKW